MVLLNLPTASNYGSGWANYNLGATVLAETGYSSAEQVEVTAHGIGSNWCCLIGWADCTSVSADSPQLSYFQCF